MMVENIDDRTRAEFEQFELRGITVTENELGRGSYAVVLELHFRGLKCAGKKLHCVLYETGIGHAAHRYIEECRLLSQTRHPNIVQFLGVCFEEGSQFPILVMEFLPTNLTSCLERYGVLPDEINYSILNDVSLGLSYLHGQTPIIIHRDLSGNNVLLSTNMSAKISDLGVAKILNLTPLQQMTETPGTQAYMPPEVMVADPQYGVSVDEFSFGALMVHTFTAEWPAPKVGPNRVDPANPHCLIPVSEAERREYFLQKIGQDHPLMDLITRCLSNNPAHRPNAQEIVGRVSDVALRFPPSFENRVEMLHRISEDDIEKKQLQQVVDRRAAQIKEKEQEVATVLQEKEREVFFMKQEKERQQEHVDEMERLTLATSTEVEQLKLHIADKESIIKLQKTEMANTIATCERKTAEISSLTSDLSSTRAALDKKEATIEGLDSQLTRTRAYLTSKPQPLQTSLSFSQCADAPVAMNGAEFILIGDRGYYGGGYTEPPEDAHDVYCYSPCHDEWSALPPHPYIHFGLGQFEETLLTVGGWSTKVRGEMYRYDKRWFEIGIPMPTARRYPAVISQPTCLIVAGGVISKKLEYTDVVEIYNIDTLQWSQANSLPIAAVFTPVVHDNTVHLFGCRDKTSRLNKAFVASINRLLSSASVQLLTQTTKDRYTGRHLDSQSVWNEITHTPAYWSSALVTSNMILAMGGYSSSDLSISQSVKGVYAYSTSMKSWIHIADLPAPLLKGTVAALSPSELIVIGGLGADSQRVKTVYKGIFCTTVT